MQSIFVLLINFLMTDLSLEIVLGKIKELGENLIGETAALIVIYKNER